MLLYKTYTFTIIFQKIWMIIWCFAPKLNFLHQQLYSSFHCFKFLLVQTAVKLRNYQIDTAWIIHFLSSFQTYLWGIGGTHDSKNIFQSSWIQLLLRGAKKCVCQMLLSFSKMKVLLWHHYQVIHRYENLHRVTYLFMYISIIL